MNDVLVAAIVALPATILALATLVVSLKNTAKVEQVHKATNSLLDRLIAATKLSSHAEGVADERKRHEP